MTKIDITNFLLNKVTQNFTALPNLLRKRHEIWSKNVFDFDEIFVVVNFDHFFSGRHKQKKWIQKNFKRQKNLKFCYFLHRLLHKSSFLVAFQLPYKIFIK